jgi:hypothetical protein
VDVVEQVLREIKNLFLIKVDCLAAVEDFDLE